MKKQITSTILSLFFLSTTTGCSSLIKKVAIDSTALVIDDALTQFYAEPDVQLADDAAPANLKLLEGLIKGDPDNEKLLLMGSKLMGSYSFGFLEQRLYSYEREDEALAMNKRAKGLYRRGMDYGMKALKHDSNFANAVDGNFEEFEKAVAKLGKDKIDLLFWTAYNWGNWINQSKDNPMAVSQLGRVEIMMRRVLELDETYYYGGPHLFYIVYYGGRPAMLGGNLEKAKYHYEQAMRITEGKLLMVPLVYATFYGVQTLDQDLFTETLEGILEAPDDILPEEMLINSVSKKEATRLLKLVDEIF